MRAAAVEQEPVDAARVAVRTATSPPRWYEEVSSRWHEVVADACLHDLPYRIETNREGQLIMRPAKNVHGFLQMRVGEPLTRTLGGRTFAECSIATTEGVKVADAAWCSDAFFSMYGFAGPHLVAPEICVGIESPSNAELERRGKVRRYLDAGAKEVWLVDGKGVVRVFGLDGMRTASAFDVDVAEVRHAAGEADA